VSSKTDTPVVPAELEDVVVLGKIVDAYGIQGWVRIHTFGDDPLEWKHMPVWWLGPEQGPWQPYQLKQCRLQGEHLVAKFAEVADRGAAEGLHGLFVAAQRSDLPPAGDDAYYWADLIGLAVVNLHGAALGKIDSLIETGANDVLQVVADDGTKRLLPFVDAVVREVDIKAGKVVVDWELDW
jgi:16S rRNA processing protein RimM